MIRVKINVKVREAIDGFNERQELPYTDEQIAGVARISSVTLHRILKGESEPSLSTLRKLAVVLEITDISKLIELEKVEK